MTDRHFVVGFALFILTSGTARAQEPASEPPDRIANGNGYTVCEAFLGNLNAFPADEPAMICEQEIRQEHPEFSRPVWEDLEVSKHLRLIYNAERLLWRFTPIGTEAKPFEEWERAYHERIRIGETDPRLRRTVVTLADNEETLIWYEPVVNACERELDTSGLADGPGGIYSFCERRESCKPSAACWAPSIAQMSCFTVDVPSTSQRSTPTSRTSTARRSRFGSLGSIRHLRDEHMTISTSFSIDANT
jgi:hypothetical protein